MTAPTGNPGPDLNLFEQRWRRMGQELEALSQRGIRLAFEAVPLYPKFTVAASTVFTAMSTAVNVVEQTLWEGRIASLAHPYVQVDGSWGAATGTNNTRYRLKIDAVTVGTWDVALAAAGVHGPFLTTTAAVIGSTNVPITLTAQSLTGSGTYKCQVLGCHLRQT